MKMRATKLGRLCQVAMVAGVAAARVSVPTDWPTPGHDAGNQRYSPLTQIDTGNVSKLLPAWTFQLKKEGALFRPSESIPLFIDGILYISWPRFHLAALQPETGKVLWEYTARGAFVGNGLADMRSMAYWAGDRKSPPEILFGTEEGELVALNAKTGKPIPTFGKEGVVNLKTPEVMNGFPNMHLGITSAPLVFRNLVITGSHLVDETGSKGPAGDVRAWDVRTGKLVWTFHTVPRPGEVGHESWRGDDWKNVSGVNVWTFFAADEKHGILYLPLGSANNDYYGVDRPGTNLFANSLVAVDAMTGKLKWYFQAIHHDLWDYDMPVPPILFDVVRNGQRIPAVGAMTKLPMLFILNRLTGKPVYGVEERPVPQGNLPGEWYSPTQPFPLKPPPLGRLSFTIDDIAKITPEHEQACRALLGNLGPGSNRGPYTPASEAGSLSFPSANGGALWSGGTFDPKLGYYIINTTDSGSLWTIRKQDSDPQAPPESPRLYGRGTGGRGRTAVNGWPCWAPPWGRLTAVNVNTGEFAWQIPFGATSGVPAGLETGGVNSGAGPITTAGGLIFIGADRAGYFRAYETSTGKLLWSAKLEEVATSVPITYMGHDGKQYVAIPAGSKLVTFTLP
jgi:quinoprotein glucose dehydrogenase